MADWTRREFLKRTTSLGAFAFACTLLPPNVRRAVAAAGSPGGARSLRDVRHVVLLLQENRSFDHYFGTLPGVRGFADPGAMRLATGRSVFHQPDAANPDGYLLPFHLDTHASNAQKIPSTNHTWVVQHEAWHGGAMDGWVTAHRRSDQGNAPYCMGYYTRADIPFHYALAEAFTVCDAYHCSVLGPTYPNRLYWMTGTIDPEGRDGGPVEIGNEVPAGGFAWTTYAERLEAAGVPWKVYRTDDRAGLNVLRDFRGFRNAARGSSLHARGGMEAGPDGAFEDAAAHGRLPAVSWIIPPFEDSEHPDFMPAAGAAFIARKLDALAVNPETWNSTVCIVAYDENDGLFDHVPPPVPPAGTPREFLHGQPIGAGFRAPCVIVSPWTVGGWVCSEPFDHTSVLRFLERFTGVPEPNISDWRRQAFGDLTLPLRFGGPSPSPALPDTAGPLAAACREVASLPAPAFPGAEQQPPQQEPGARPHVPDA